MGSLKMKEERKPTRRKFYRIGFYLFMIMFFLTLTVPIYRWCLRPGAGASNALFALPLNF
jgi:hypothetical protein